MDYRCALFSDLSSVGKSSLTVMAPALEMLGVEACPVATALFSTQSDGFLDPYGDDTTEAFCGILDTWDHLGLEFDGVYSGWFMSEAEVKRVEAFVKRRPSLFFLCDPVMGDDGALYQGMPISMPDQIRELASYATLVTPNPTEAALLVNTKTIDASMVKQLPGKQHVITGYHDQDRWGVVMDDGFVPFNHHPASFPGTGDLFDAILLGLLIKGWKLQDAVEACTTLVFLAVERTVREKKFGISVASIRKELASL